MRVSELFANHIQITGKANTFTFASSFLKKMAKEVKRHPQPEIINGREMVTTKSGYKYPKPR